MFTAMLRQCGYRNYIPIMVHNKPLQLNTKHEYLTDFVDFKLDEKVKKEVLEKDMFKFLDTPNGTYIH